MCIEGDTNNTSKMLQYFFIDAIELFFNPLDYCLDEGKWSFKIWRI